MNRHLILLFISLLPVATLAQTPAPRKSLFLTTAERASLQALPSTSPSAALLSALQARVSVRATSPGLSDRSTTTDWWHHAAEYLTDAALIHAVRPSPDVAAWLRSEVLAIVRRPMADWAGPAFRGYTGGPMVGNLETSHLTWGIAIAYDLASDLFTADECAEITTALRDRGLIPCRRYLDNAKACTNWNCVLLAGYTVAAAVLDDEPALAQAAAWFPLATDHFQADGSYGESLQYANYAGISIALAHEALRRHSRTTSVTLEPYARMVDWAAQALFYRKPLSGWGTTAWPRSANFGDSAAIFRPSGDLLIHIAVRAKQSLPVQAGLARWLFDSLYFPAHEPGPHDRASFGMVNGFGFLSVIMLAEAAAPISPTDARLPATAAFSSGDAFARDAWDGSTTLAVRLPSEPRHASAHLHGDINSFILVHNRERLLVDPGHACYRNLSRELDVSSISHNTCTFEIPASAGAPARTLIQRNAISRPILRGQSPLRAAAPPNMGGRRLITSRVGPVSVLGSDAAQLYGAPLRTFTRLWVLCGSHALFVVDRIESDVPLRTTWNWLLNNRDGLLDLKLGRPDRITARRGNAGLSLSHFGGGNMGGPTYAFVHDAYHPLPAQLGEGRPGSGLMIRWTAATPATPGTARTVVHAVAVDDHSAVLGWTSKRENSSFTLDGPDRNEKWTLRTADDGGLFIEEAISQRTFTVSANAAGVWSLAVGK